MVNKGLIYSVFLFLIVCSACSSPYAQGVRFHRDGQARTSVAFVPIQDRADHELPWNVAEELAMDMETLIEQQYNLYLSQDQAVDIPVSFWNERDWQKTTVLKDLYPRSEFIVLVELLEHYYQSYERQKIKPLYMADGEASRVLSLLARIQVLDLRGEFPKPVLQQIIPSNHMVPLAKEGANYLVTPWGSETYYSTPVGAAHARLSRDVVNQITRYVQYAKR